MDFVCGKIFIILHPPYLLSRKSGFFFNPTKLEDRFWISELRFVLLDDNTDLSRTNNNDLSVLSVLMIECFE